MWIKKLEIDFYGLRVRRFLVLETLYNFDSLYSILLQQNADNFSCTETRRRFLFICIMCKHVCGSTFISIQVVMT